jgi:PAS domain S-box-containing protein
MILMGLAILLPVVGSVLVEVLIPYKGIRPAVSGLDLTLVMAAIMAYAVSRRGLLGDVLSSMGRAVLPAMKDSVFVLGPTGVVEAANPAAEEFTGFAREELVGSSLASVFRDYQQYRSLAESMAGGGDFDSTARCFARDGAAKWVSVVSVPIRSGSERLIGFVVILHDITDTLELIRAEERVRVSALEADMQRDYSNELRNIIDVAGHELRHPASVFKGYTSTLIHNWDSMERETVEDFMQALDMASDRLTRLTVDLLDVSYIESEGMQLEHEHVKPQALLAAAVMEVKTRDYSQDFVIASDDDDRTILADSEKIESVMAVLLENAAKFSPEDSPLEIGFRVEGKYAVFYVADRGRGVPEGHREKIFKRLYQVDDAQHHSTPGLGLGLYIAYEIVSAHHGWIRMDPREGGGSVFSFGLPLEP